MRADLALGLARGAQRVWGSRGWTARLLLPFAALFGCIVALRRGLYRSGILRTHRLDVPVVVVGNLVVGGAGKTPAVISIVESLQRNGYAPGVVARGYGRKTSGIVEVTRTTSADESGDEALLIHLRTGAPVCVAAERPAAALALLARHPGIDVVVSDDGLQHLALGRDVEVVVFDDRGGGNGWLLPAGPLREPLERAVSDRILRLYTAGRATTPLPGWLGRRSLSGATLLEDWRQGAGSRRRSLEDLQGRKLFAAAAIARPERFFALLEAAGLRIVALPLADHADFDALPWPQDAQDVIVTEKDAVKLDPRSVGKARVWVATLDFEPDPGFERALLDRLRDLTER